MPFDIAGFAFPKPGRTTVSFEFFPPKTEKAAEALLETAAVLSSFRPQFMSVTYGAGGSTRDRSVAVASELVQRTRVPIAGHLTCVHASRDDIASVARGYWAAGIRHIVALRGDPPIADPVAAQPEAYRDVAELVADLRNIAPFEISVAAYPEVHPKARDARSDLDNLKAKLDAGATRAITQFFFTPEAFLRFRDRAAGRGITAEIVPGILPIANIAQAYKFAAMCGTSIPDDMRRLFHNLDERPEVRALVTLSVTATMCRFLQERGVDNFHIYTLNHAAPSVALCRLLGLSDHTHESAAEAARSRVSEGLELHETI